MSGAELIRWGNVFIAHPSQCKCTMPESPENKSVNIMTSPSMSSSAAHKSSLVLNGALSPHSHSSSDSPSPPNSSSAGGGVTGGSGVLGSGVCSNGTSINGNSNPAGLQSSMNGSGGSRPRELQATNCGARQLSKVKRFLTTLQQFGSDISAEAGERVRNLILNLVNGTLTIDEFHHKLQETTNFPLRPFVIPFLKANLPLLQREILHCARVAKQSPQQYLHQHEHLVLDSAHSPTEPAEVFHHSSEINENGKRRLSESRHKENGSVESLHDVGPPPKRHHLLMSPPLGHPTSSSLMGMHSSHPLRIEDYTIPREFRDRDRLNLEREYRHFAYNTPRDLLDERETEEEWKNIHTMLNCILGMVEKTKRALAILQHRSQTDRQELAMWVRRHAEGTENNLKKHAGDMMAQTLKTTEDRVSEVKRKAEEAVNEVKRQAVVELQKAVAAAEVKARELVATERGKMEKLILEARRQAAEEAMATVNQQADSNETCWNCGRKASETCSGCNVARYCGAFCQHKDWENHHHICGQSQNAAATLSTTLTSLSTISTSATAMKSITSTSITVANTSPSSSSGSASTSGTIASNRNAAVTTVTSSVTSNPTIASLSRSSGSRSSTPVDPKSALETKH